MKLILEIVYIGPTMKRSFIILGFMIFVCSLHAKTGFEITADHKTAYKLIISMQFDEGQAVIDKIKKEQPENVLIYHLENYIDFISIFISEERSLFKEKEPNKAMRLEMLKKGDPSDPYFLFSQAELHLQWAMTRMKFKEYFTAAREVNKAIGILEKNQELFPEFISNKKSLSVLHAVAGTIPDKYKGFVNLLSNFSGTIDQGLAEINEVLELTDANYLFRREAVAIKGMILLHLKNQKEEAWNFLAASEVAVADDPMAVFLMASTALKCGKNEAALDFLVHRTRSPRFFPFYYLDLMLGTAKLSRLDRDADVYLHSYIKNFQGQDYFKDAYRKLAWHALVVLEDEALYLSFMSMCLSKGSDRIDEDRSAQKDAKNGEVPNLDLVKARLLFDGGYYAKALEVLRSMDIKNLDDIEKLEYSYRKGRISQESKKVDEAMTAFTYCVNHAQDGEEYYSCNSALQLGIIFEGQGAIEISERYYRLCLELQPPEYRNSLHQKAKSGLNRIASK